MSNLLLNQAKLVEGVIGSDGKPRDLHPSEMSVLLILADDARAEAGNVTRESGTAWLCARTRLSEPSVRRAYAVLQRSGHITRLAGLNGRASATLVHPVAGYFVGSKVATSADPASKATGNADLSTTHITMIGVEESDPYHHDRGDPYHHDRGPSLVSKNLSHTGAGKRPRARVCEREDFRDEDQVYAAWNAMLEASGQPGPVTRSANRDAAIRRRLAEHGRWRVLQVVERVGQLHRRSTGTLGQSGFLLSINGVFEVNAHLSKLGMFTRLLDGGEFGPAIPREQPPEAPPAPTAPEADPHPPELADLRQRLRASVGDSAFASWLKPVRFMWNVEGDLEAVAPSNFVAEWVTGNFTAEIERLAGEGAGREVRLRVRVHRLEMA